MIVYANSFILNPAEGPKSVFDQIVVWVGRPRRIHIDVLRLSQGIRELKLPDGATLSSVSTSGEGDDKIFPYYFCARLSHGQDNVPGRRWITEIGILQTTASDPLQCSILLKVEEISARVGPPVRPTRPKIVDQLFDACSPGGSMPGQSPISLTVDNASGFKYEIERETRRFPLVIVSSDRTGDYPVAPVRLQSVLRGLGQVIQISGTTDTFALERLIGRRYTAFGGAINIIFPYRKTLQGGFSKTILFRPEQIKETEESGANIESEILTTVTHHTNIPHFWRHTGFDEVHQAVLRNRLQRAIASSEATLDSAAYEELLKEAAERADAKNIEILAIRDELETVTNELDQVRAINDGLKHALVGSESKSVTDEDSVASTLGPWRDAIVAVLDRKPGVEQSLRLISSIYSDRIVVLDTALESARESDRNGFSHGIKAFELLRNLAQEYWSALANGKSDNKAREVFGKSYSAKEAETLSKEGRRRRIFSFLGQEVLMEKHLKIGVKDSYSETLRIHFEWFADRKVIVIGHCGKHLNF